MEAHKVRSMQILAIRRMERKKKRFLEKKIQKPCPLWDQGLAERITKKDFFFLFFLFFMSIFRVYSRSLGG